MTEKFTYLGVAQGIKKSRIMILLLMMSVKGKMNCPKSTGEK